MKKNNFSRPEAPNSDVDANFKAFFVIKLLDTIFKHWASSSGIVTLETAQEPVENQEDLNLLKSDNPYNKIWKILEEDPTVTMRYRHIPEHDLEKLAMSSYISMFPLAHTKESFETFTRDICSDLFGVKYSDTRNAKEFDSIYNKLITTQLLTSMENNLHSRKVYPTIIASYYDYPFSMVRQLLFLIRRAWSSPIPYIPKGKNKIKNKTENKDNEKFLSLYDAVELSHERCLLKKEFFNLCQEISILENTSTSKKEKSLSQVDAFPNISPKDTLKEKQEQSVVLLSYIKKFEENISNIDSKKLKAQFQKITKLYMTMEYFYKMLCKFISPEFLSKYEDENTALKFSQILPGDTEAFNDNTTSSILQLELSLIALIEYEALTDYTRDFLENTSPLCYASEFIIDNLNYDFLATHLFLTTAHKTDETSNHHKTYKAYDNDFINNLCSPLKDTKVRDKIKEYGSLINKNCSNCKYVTHTKTKEVCQIGGCTGECKIHNQLLFKGLEMALLLQKNNNSPSDQ